MLNIENEHLKHTKKKQTLFIHFYPLLFLFRLDISSGKINECKIKVRGKTLKNYKIKKGTAPISFVQVCTKFVHIN